MFDTKLWENWVAIVLMLTGFLLYLKLAAQSRPKHLPVSGVVLVFIGLILALAGRYKSKKRNGSMEKLKSHGSEVALSVGVFGVIIGLLIPLYRTYKGYSGKQPLLMGFGMTMMCLATSMALFFQLEAPKQ